MIYWCIKINLSDFFSIQSKPFDVLWKLIVITPMNDIILHIMYRSIDNLLSITSQSFDQIRALFCHVYLQMMDLVVNIHNEWIAIYAV